MATKTTTKKSKTEEAVSKTASRLAEMFLDRISEIDENGERQIIKDPKILGDWAKPWTRRGSQAPHNPFTGSGYRGGNAALLMFAAFEQDHACYGTFNNWRKLTTEVKNKDGEVTKPGVVVSVKKGESAWQGIHWKQSYVCAQGCRGFKKTRAEITAACGHDARLIWTGQNFSVFGYWQVEITPTGGEARPIEPGTDFDFHPDYMPGEIAEPPKAPEVKEHFLKTGATFTEGITGAYYTPATDTVNVPPADMFKSLSTYASTMAHEFIHWTGSPDRLGACTGSGCKKCEKGFYHRRLTMEKKGYAAEELVAEIGACILVSDFGIDHTPLENEGAESNHGAYILGWMQPLLNAVQNADGERIIWDATQAADKAARFITDLTGPFDS